MKQTLWRMRWRRRTLFGLLILTFLAIVVVTRHTQLGQEASNLLRQKPNDAGDETAPGNSFYGSRDWHDYEAIARDAALQRSNGLGERGRPAALPNNLTQDEAAKSLQKWGFNAKLSQLISHERSLDDFRHKSCQKRKYFSDLPKVSVVIALYNEEISVLLRTLYSIRNRTPAELLEEIILVVDDSSSSSSAEILERATENDFRQRKIKIIRAANRIGLIRARLLGASVARAEVLIFLDAHVEATHNWLPPLLHPIRENAKTCTTPLIDTIDYENFAYRPSQPARGGFNWQFNYVQLPLLAEEQRRLPDPHENPIMNGGLFAIAREFFWYLGGYDSGLEIWGAEQFELSFKIWMCGGRLLEVPCSRLGHLYRSPEFRVQYTNRTDDFIARNYKRVAEVWMDSYKEILYERIPKLNVIDAGNLHEQKSLRKRLNCKNFKWFLETIAGDLMRSYPPMEPNDFAYGALQTLAAPQFCLDSQNQRARTILSALELCSPDLRHPYASQLWHWGFRHDIRNANGLCLEVQSLREQKNAPIWLWPCHNQAGNQYWYYDRNSKLLAQGIGVNGRRCLEANIAERRVYVNSCDFAKATMKWTFGYVNETAMQRYFQNNNTQNV